MDDLLERLANHRALGDAPRSEHEWLVAHGRLRHMVPGEILTKGGEAATTMTVLFSGEIVIHVDRGAGSHRIFQWTGGDVGGLLPFSRGARPPNDAVAEQHTEMLEVQSDVFPELIRECPNITAKLVHAMLDRARMFSASDLRDEKLVSLGKLAAGLAHELNNPASAAVRSAKHLTEAIRAADEAAALVTAAHLSDEQMAAIDEVRVLCANSLHTTGQSAIERADREDAIADWLEDRGANVSCAGPLSESGATIEVLDTLSAKVSGPPLNAALRWISSGCQMRALSAEIETATARIHEIVNTIKGFTFMDRAPTIEAIDIHRGLNDSLKLLGSKSRAKNAEIKVDIPDDLPLVRAVGAEINQVWMNLIENALDAIPNGGHIAVVASADRDRVIIRVTDDGPGIPKEIVGRIFDPFFTTKDVGKGTGLGLDTVRRIVARHLGEVHVDSKPGRTEFSVTLRAGALATQTSEYRVAI